MNNSPRLLAFGQLASDYILTHTGKSHLEIPGGEAVYCAAGMRSQGEFPSICARIGEMYPQQWLNRFNSLGISTAGVIVHPDVTDTVRFFAYLSQDTYTQDSPLSHFARLNTELPKALLGYTNPVEQTDSQLQAGIRFIRSTEIPELCLDAQAAHLCPMDYISFYNILHALKQNGFHTISIDPGLGMMNALFFNAFADLVRDVTIFHTNETRLKQLFFGQTEDIWEMAQAVAQWGPEIVVIRSGNQGQYLLDNASKIKWLVPAYPNQLKDAIGAGSVFCGAFLADYLQHFDPLKACLTGSITASFAIEGFGPFYILNTLPELIGMRFEKLHQMVQRV